MMLSTSKQWRVLAVAPHPDDFEFNIGGTFAALREAHGEAVTLGVLVVSSGASGHHRMSPEETVIRRQEEARASAALVGAEAMFLRGLDGQLITTQVLADRNLLGGLWNAVLRFAPDVIIAPPVASDPLAGVHVDHEMTAQALRLVAYQLSVPNAYPRHHGVEWKPRLSPVILHCDDVYHQPSGWDFRVDVSRHYPLKEEMALCHRSQVFEWLPFLRGEPEPVSKESVLASFRRRHEWVNERYGCPSAPYGEYFRLTRWGRVTTREELRPLFAMAEFPPA